MKIPILVSAILLFMSQVAACATEPRPPVRTVVQIGGPELVFATRLADIFPQLDGATATGVNGRVGNEAVFWGFRLQDNRTVNLIACAPLEGVDCEARLLAVCPAGGEELARINQPGLVREMHCRPVGMAHPGELYPNCDDRETNNSLVVGLSQCQ